MRGGSDAGTFTLFARSILLRSPPASMRCCHSWTRENAACLLRVRHAARAVTAWASACRPTPRRARAASHPDRNAQFEHINAAVVRFRPAGQPAISVDTKKKELVGDFKNAGRELRPKGQPEEVRVHDFIIPKRQGARRALRASTTSTTRQPGLGQCRHRPRHRRLRRREHPPLVAAARAQALSQGRDATAHHRRLRRQQRRPPPPLEVRAAELSPTRPGSGHHRRPSPARHQQVEPHRASPVRLHHPELARQAAGQSRGHRPADRQHDHRYRPHRRLSARRQYLCEGPQGL